MEQVSIKYCIDLALKKKKILDQSLIKYLTRAALASIYISFILIVCLKLAELFRLQNSPFSTVAYPLAFSTALIMIIYGGGELFTSNTMYFTFSTLAKKTTKQDLVKNWIACYAGNIIGAFIFAIIYFFTGLAKDFPANHFLTSVVDHKIHASFSTLFFKGVLCNWLVCLACFLPTRFKDDFAKMLLIFLLVFAFFFSGYEHSIANIAVFTLSFILPHDVPFTFGDVYHNLLPVTLGNIIGGSVGVGVAYYFLNNEQKLEVKELKRVS
ncbi:formate/nitrite transporter family protein [Bacillus sp. AFS055030]|uniref:formate/nitrite transporter family protein n=1 Tax=Bacillus sp. AFS055030 TaxID=2033507 RepID=UPI000BFC9536|nr:formate/nitrite transporter family protein [Bacillus sp. AFS055030]PGL71672.1 transporter [Bacillus sp. AFS055030]